MYKICETCNQYRFCNNPCTMGVGNNLTPQIIFLFDQPDEKFDADKELGVIGDILSRALHEPIDEILKYSYVTFLTKCPNYTDKIGMVGNTRSHDEATINNCKTILFRELKQFSEPLIMTFGNSVLTSMLAGATINESLGSTYKITVNNANITIVPNFHPFYVSKNMGEMTKFRSVLLSALGRKATNQSEIKLCNYEESMERMDWMITEHKKGNFEYCIFDTETDSLSAWGMTEYFGKFNRSQSLMASIALPSHSTSYVIPFLINNDFILENTADAYSFGYENQARYEEIKQEKMVKFALSATQSARIHKMTDQLFTTIPLVGHNLKFDIKFRCVERNIDPTRVKIHDDTLIMAHQLFGRVNNQSLSLKDLCRREFEVDEDWEKTKDKYLGRFRKLKDRHFGNIPTGILWEYAALDAAYNKMLYEMMCKKIPADMWFMIKQVTNSVISFVDAESKGIFTDEKMFNYIKDNYELYLTKVRGELYSMPMVQKFIDDKFSVIMEENSKKKKPKVLTKEDRDACFSLTSNKNLQEIVYNQKYYGLNTHRKFMTDAGAPSTGAEALENYISKCDIPALVDFSQCLMKFKDINTLKTRYVDSHGDNVKDGFFKSDFNLTGTATGRLCLAGDTRVSLLNGQEVCISELPVDAWFYIYGSNIDGTVSAHRAISLGVTKTTNQICEVTLDNNEVIRCTPDHRFMLRDGSYKEAQYLTPNDSLMPLYRRVNENGYEEYKDNASGKWIQTHQMVAYDVHKGAIKECWRDIKENNKPDRFLVVHHKNIKDRNNKRNNDPINLQWMGEKDHWMLHAKLGRVDLMQARLDEIGRSKIAFDNWSNPEYKEKMSIHLREQNRLNWQSKEYQLVMSRQGMVNPNNFKNNELLHKKAVELSKPVVSRVTKDRWANNYDEEYNRIVESRKQLLQDPVRREALCKSLSESLINYFKTESHEKKISRSNKTKLQHKDPEYRIRQRLGRINSVIMKVKENILMGYPTYHNYMDLVPKLKRDGVIGKNCPYPISEQEFDRAVNYNHKIKQVVMKTLDNTIDMYDLEVPDTNNFALSAGVFVHNSSGFHTLPSKSDLKRVFISRWKNEGGLFVCADASQLEVRIGCAIANETTMIEAYSKGVDVHTDTAALMYHKTIEEVTGKERKNGKQMNFGVFYGKGPKSISEELNCSKEEAIALIEAFFSSKQKLRDWIKEQHKFVRKYGFAVTPFNRIIPIPEALSSEQDMVSYGERRSVNNVVQSAASDCMLIANNYTYNDVKAANLKSLFLGTVHDSTEFDTYPGELIKIIYFIKNNFEKRITAEYPWITCPLLMDFSIGTSWGSAIEFKIKEYSENRVVMEGEGYSKDIRSLELALKKAYNYKMTILEKVPVDQSTFGDDVFIRDTENWKVLIELTE